MLPLINPVSMHIVAYGCNTGGIVVWCGFDESDFVAAGLNGRACVPSM
jgi:hypothetical protein